MEIDPEPTLLNVGGKAYQLYRLMQYVNVPPFFVVSFNEPREISELAVQRTILKECEARNFDLMAVRSSAVCEDSEKTSFAGMFKTVLCVRPVKLIEAIGKVLNSVLSKRVQDYCRAHNIDQSTIKMAVVIQKMIPGRVSGVCFTGLQKEINCLLIEACYGLGEILVSGKASPDSYFVDRNTMSLVRENIGYQKLLLKIINENGRSMIYEKIPFHRRNSRKLTYEEIHKIAETCLRIERDLHFNAADVEWTFEGNVLYILQAREFTGYTT